MPSPQELLAAVEQSTTKRESARVEQLEAIRSAVRAGLPITHIAKAAHLSREHVYRLARG